MIDFDFKGISVSAVSEFEPMSYLDSDNRSKVRYDKATRVHVDFWDFRIYRDNSLYELAAIKSSLQYFMQNYWKRSSKEGSKIDLTKAIRHESTYEPDSILYFIARQKDKKHFLHVCLQKGGNTINEVYLDEHDVMALDIAIAKAIGLLSPTMIDHDHGMF